MPILRINQQPGGAPNYYRIDVSAVDVPNFQPPSFSRPIEFDMPPRDGERIRWYLEDYLQFDEDPAPAIAKQVENLMAARGEALFRSIFEGLNEGVQLWTLIQPHLSSTRIEITTGIAEATEIPWELIRNPHTGTNLALSAQAIVRTQQAAQLALAPQAEAEKVRILLVICRPKGGKDVPFRSVAGRLVTRLSEGDREAFQLHVLRPPTYEQLAETLLLAKERSRPYHIIHFDGHGVYADPKDLEGAGKILSSLTLKGEATGARGYLAFEDPGSKTRCKFVDGFAAGALLRDAGVPILILNACQSAFAEARAKPDEAASVETREEIEAYGSLAQAVMEPGAAGVVAMRYSVYVVTAAQFVAELYAALARGRGLGEAATWARKNLANQPERRIAYETRPLQDWLVPVVWERAPLRLWPQKPGAAPITITMDDAAAAKPGALDQALPERPDVGFFGRDETLYALDRAFDTHRIVLLHAYAGSGKTTTAAEFARWYALTGGVEGPVLFTSFERHLLLARALDKIGAVFGRMLEGSGIHWDAVTDAAARRKIALDILRKVPVLWIWDNVEPVTGFPAGTKSDWSMAEQQELRAFLNAARDTKAKFLLTSRRAEEAWLGELPRRVQVPPMPMQERLQLAGAIVEHRGKRLADLPDLTPLLRFTHGNPLTILVTVGEALRASIATKDRLDAFVGALRNGAAAFEDEETEGRSKSLGASLSYGFGTAFGEDERKILALLHLFQGFVDVDALRFMGATDEEWSIEAMRGLTRERGIALLDRAAELGLLDAHGGGYYGVHPALPWYFRTLFERFYRAEAGGRARRAFAEAISDLSHHYCSEFLKGHRQLMPVLMAEEDNLLAAWRLAREQGWWRSVMLTTQGLMTLYDATSRNAARRLLVETIVPDFIDPATGGALPGREEEWGIMNQNLVFCAREDRDWPKAERLQRLGVNWARECANPALATAPEIRNSNQRNAIRTLAVSVHDLAQIQREKGDLVCAEAYQEAFSLADAIDDEPLQAVCAFNLSRAYRQIADLRNLNETERWLRRSLDLRHSGDALGRGKCFGELGNVLHERLREAKAAKRPADELKAFFTEAKQFYKRAIELVPKTAIIDQGVYHGQLGAIYNSVGKFDRALYHHRLDISYCEKANDTFGAGQARFNCSVVLINAGRFDDARTYAEAALANYQTFSERASAEIRNTERLIAKIGKAAAEQRGNA